MSYFNKVTLVGRATRDPDHKILESGLQVTKFSLAVNRGFSKDSKDQVDFIDIITWEKLAENVASYVTKGKLLLVDGRLQIRSYEDKEGIKRKVAEVVANTVRFLDKKDNGKSDSYPNSYPKEEDAPPWMKKEAANGAIDDDDDIPF